MRNLLLLTATIAPAAGMPGVGRANLDLRRRDYEEALRSWLGRPGTAIDEVLFCENSGADLGSLGRIAAEENPRGVPVRFLSFVSDCDPARGKGYSELDILDRAYRAFLADADPATRVWKITGRLMLDNLKDMVATAPRDFGLYVDFRSVPLIGEMLGGNDWVDFRFFGFSPEGFAAYLLGKNDRVGFTIEKSLFGMLRPRLGESPAIVPRFCVQPVFSGVCAGSGVSYDSLGYRLKNTTRRASRRLAPSLWL